MEAALEKRKQHEIMHPFHVQLNMRRSFDNKHSSVDRFEDGAGVSCSSEHNKMREKTQPSLLCLLRCRTVLILPLKQNEDGTEGSH